MKYQVICPYLCQFDNKLYPGGSCNLTSLGMCLEHYGKKVPGPYARISDNLLHYADQAGLDRHALPDIAKISKHFGLGDNAGYTDTFEQIKQHLVGGNLVIVQGNFTASGHIIVVRGFDTVAGTFCCNDPAGNYFAPNHYSNPGWESGENVWYPSQWFREKAAPDGKVWAHLLG